MRVVPIVTHAWICDLLVGARQHTLLAVKTMFNYTGHRITLQRIGRHCVGSVKYKVYNFVTKPCGQFDAKEYAIIFEVLPGQPSKMKTSGSRAR